MENIIKSGYTVYNNKVKKKTKINLLTQKYLSLPDSKFSILYADPPWHYNGKLQFDLSGTLRKNRGWKRDVFVSAASFRYPTLTITELKELNISSIAENDSLHFFGRLTLI